MGLNQQGIEVDIVNLNDVYYNDNYMTIYGDEILTYKEVIRNYLYPILYYNILVHDDNKVKIRSNMEEET